MKPVCIRVLFMVSANEDHGVLYLLLCKKKSPGVT